MPPTNTISLSSLDINGSKAAHRIFGLDKSVIVARPASRCSLFWFTVPEGFYALVSRHGAQVDYNGPDGDKSCVWPAGLHLGVSEGHSYVYTELFLRYNSTPHLRSIYGSNSPHG